MFSIDVSKCLVFGIGAIKSKEALAVYLLADVLVTTRLCGTSACVRSTHLYPEDGTTAGK